MSVNLNDPSPDFKDFVVIDYDHWGHGHKCYIVNPEIKDVHLRELTKEYLNYSLVNSKKNPILNYCIDRCIHCNDAMNLKHWVIKLREFYYGHEIASVSFEKHISILEDINQLLDISNNNMIEYVLKKEYGHLLECVKNRDWIIKNIDKDLVIIGNKDHYENLSSKFIHYYSNCELPRCIVIPEGKKYRLIDGYHRLAASHEEQVSVIIGQIQWDMDI